MKKWELQVIKSRLNLWLIVLGDSLFLCEKNGDIFSVKGNAVITINPSLAKSIKKI